MFSGMEVKKALLVRAWYVDVLGLDIFKKSPYSKSYCNWGNDVLTYGLNKLYCHVFSNLARAAVIAACAEGG